MGFRASSADPQAGPYRNGRDVHGTYGNVYAALMPLVNECHGDLSPASLEPDKRYRCANAIAYEEIGPIETVPFAMRVPDLLIENSETVPSPLAVKTNFPDGSTTT